MKVTLVNLNQFQASSSILKPYDKDAKKAVGSFSDGQLIVVDIQTQRNPQFHRLAFAMMQQLYDMVDEPMPFDSWRKLMLIKGGYFTSLGKVHLDGSVTSAVIPHSMAYEAMEEDDFKKCINNLIQVFIDKYAKKITYEQLEKAARGLDIK